MQYRLTESRVKRVLRHPRRREVGVAEDTLAGMQPAGSKSNPYEIWVMWTLASARAGAHDKADDSGKSKNRLKFNFGKKIIIISAWRYPGVSPLREAPPIPDDVWAALREYKKESGA